MIEVSVASTKPPEIGVLRVTALGVEYSHPRQQVHSPAGGDHIHRRGKLIASPPRAERPWLGPMPLADPRQRKNS